MSQGLVAAIGNGIAWIGDEGTGTVSKVDRATGRVLQRTRLDDVHALALG